MGISWGGVGLGLYGLGPIKSYLIHLGLTRQFWTTYLRFGSGHLEFEVLGGDLGMSLFYKTKFRDSRSHAWRTAWEPRPSSS